MASGGLLQLPQARSSAPSLVLVRQSLLQFPCPLLPRRPKQDVDLPLNFEVPTTLVELISWALARRSGPDKKPGVSRIELPRLGTRRLPTKPRERGKNHRRRRYRPTDRTSRETGLSK
jgi:hypothetical protein